MFFLLNDYLSFFSPFYLFPRSLTLPFDLFFLDTLLFPSFFFPLSLLPSPVFLPLTFLHSTLPPLLPPFSFLHVSGIS